MLDRVYGFESNTDEELFRITIKDDNQMNYIKDRIKRLTLDHIKEGQELEEINHYIKDYERMLNVFDAIRNKHVFLAEQSFALSDTLVRDWIVEIAREIVHLNVVYTLEEVILELTDDNHAVCITGELKGTELFLTDGKIHCEEPNGISYMVTEFNDSTDSKWILKS